MSWRPTPTYQLCLTNEEPAAALRLAVGYTDGPGLTPEEIAADSSVGCELVTTPVTVSDPGILCALASLRPTPTVTVLEYRCQAGCVVHLRVQRRDTPLNIMVASEEGVQRRHLLFKCDRDCDDDPVFHVGVRHTAPARLLGSESGRLEQVWAAKQPGDVQTTAEAEGTPLLSRAGLTSWLADVVAAVVPNGLPPGDADTLARLRQSQYPLHAALLCAASTACCLQLLAHDPSQAYRVATLAATETTDEHTTGPLLCLHLSVLRRAHIDVVRAVLTANPSAIDVAGAGGRRPLHQAAMLYENDPGSATWPDIVTLLFNASPEQELLVDDSGRRPSDYLRTQMVFLDYVKVLKRRA